MKKIVALVLAAMMLLACTAFAEPTKIEYGTENTLVYARDVEYAAEAADVDSLGNLTNSGAVPTGYAHVTSWFGEWVLVAAYMAEGGIEEYELEDAEEGYYAVPENAVFLTLESKFDARANEPSTGPIVDQGNYFHAHVYDMGGAIVLPEDIDEDGYKVAAYWEDWAFEVRGEQVGDFNFGPTKVTLKGEDDYLYWNDLTGFDFDEIEEFKYIGMNLDGQIVIAACEKNPVKNAEAEVWFALIFDKYVPAEEEAAE